MDWGLEWQKAHELSPLKVTAKNESKWNDYWSICSHEYLEESRTEEGMSQEIVNWLVKQGLIINNDAVLDIGSSPGTYTLPLAEKVAKVTALDSSPGMLNELKHEFSLRKLNNIETKCGRWEDIDQDLSYDMVLTSLSPAIQSKESLLSMENVSRRSCCLITACSSDEMKSRNELWEMIVGPFHPSNADDVKYPLNILLESGRRPCLNHFTGTVKFELDERKVVRNFIHYFSIFTEMGPDKE